MVDVSEVYLSAGCNGSSKSCVGTLAGNSFVIASESELIVGRIEELNAKFHSSSPRSHARQIKCVRKCRGSGKETSEFLISGGSDGRVVVWQVEDRTRLRPVFTKDFGKGNTIGTVSGYHSTGKLVLLASWVGANSESAVLTINLKDGVYEETQSTRIPTNGAFILCADFHILQDSLIMACGTSKRTIELYHQPASMEKEFQHGLSIPAHGDWVHDVSFTGTSESALLASAGQDTYVKLWRIERTSERTDPDELTVTKNTFNIVGVTGEPITLEMRVDAVLSGHEDWVHSVSWNSDGTRLVTSSSDKSVIVWAESEVGQVWTDLVRLGIVGGQAAGFFSADFTADGRHIIASSYYGGLHGWIVSKEDETLWEPLSMPGGHASEVRDIAWEPKGNYLLSVGKDQTTRVHARVQQQGMWREISRPQMHGHDMQCIVAIDSARFVSGAEEKIFRAFSAPQTFANSLEAISGVNKEEAFAGCHLSEFGARVPALGLSNKAIEEGEVSKEEESKHWEEAAFDASPVNLSEPPTEDCLLQNTLWPELHKLYGHGYEVYAVAVNPRGTVLATSCKASHAEHANILLWSTEDWSQRAQASGHQLTVTQIEFSPDGRKMISCGRDRTVVLYKEQDGNVDGFNWAPVWRSAKEHTRIVWSCAWLDDSEHFVSSSRDQKVIVWRWDEDSQQATLRAAFKAPQSVTAVAVSYGAVNEAIIVGGFQDGSLMFLSLEGDFLVHIGQFGDIRVPGVDSPITRIRFSPNSKKDQKEQLLAVSGNNMKILKIHRD